MSTVAKKSVVLVKENTEHRKKQDITGHILNMMRYNKSAGRELFSNGRRE